MELNAYSRKEERYQINHPSLYLRKLDQEEQNQSKASRKEEITK